MPIASDSAKFEYPPAPHLVNGIFKGGGAKGIVYTGALHEVRARGIWFSSVAGASAGAITAALIAAGYDPTEMMAIAPSALQQVKKNLLTWLGDADRGLFKTADLRSWIEESIRAKYQGPRPDGAITFAELADQPGAIELNVVAMDLARYEPIVFNATLTPDFSVAEAVIASSAIPVAMPSRRVIVRRAGRVDEIHRLIDGGTWANYPAFVYRDASLRSFFRLPALKTDETLGFVIEGKEYGAQSAWAEEGSEFARHLTRNPEGWAWPPGEPPIEAPDATIESVGHRRSRFDGGSARRLGIPGALLTWAALRWVLLAALFVGVTATIYRWASLVGNRPAGSLPNPIDRAATVGAFAGVVIVVALGVLLFVAIVRFGPEAIESGLPSVFAMTSVGTSVARWVGHAADDRVVRLSAPLDISVIGFKPPAERQDLALYVAAEQAGATLNRLYGTRRKRAPIPTIAELLGRTPEELEMSYLAVLGKKHKKSSAGGGGAMLLATVWGAFLLAFVWIVPSWPSVIAAIIIGIPFTVYFLYQLIVGRMRNQSMTSSTPTYGRPWGRFAVGVLLILVGLIPLGHPQSTYDGPIWEAGGHLLGAIYELCFAVALIAGVGSIISGLSRLIANWAGRRYERELAGTKA
jgi:predicted acylesterase/phospholipase RssA